MSKPNIFEDGSSLPQRRRSELDLGNISMHELMDEIDHVTKRPTKRRKVQESSDDVEEEQPAAKVDDSTKNTMDQAKIDFASFDSETLKAEVNRSFQLFRAITTNVSLIKRIEPRMRNRIYWASRELFSETSVGRKRRNQRRRDNRKKINRNLRKQTGIRQLRAQNVFNPPTFEPPMLMEAATVSENECESSSPKKEFKGECRCYICKKLYKTVHPFYDQLCPECGDFNYKKRFQTADLHGRTALVTGGRVKIGYQAVLMLLRAGAKVIVVTRFPRDAVTRFGKEKDFVEWKDRLEIFGLDLRHTPSVEAFCKHLCETEPRLDFLINNACQTVRRPVGFYSHLMEAERQPFSTLPKEQRSLLQSYEKMRAASKRLLIEEPSELPVAVPNKAPSLTSTPGITHAAEMSQLAILDEDLDCSKQLFPKGKLDADLQQIDLRKVNSWRLELADVQTGELLEVQLVNAVAPFVLASKLKPLMMRTPERDKHIVNVSAMEGQFYRVYKSPRHPHTNMAKAALNMMTRTSAADYIRDGIHMNSVDTGWVSDENPAQIARHTKEQYDFSPPLDIVDGAARIVDPIFSGFNTGEHVWGKFLKDYKPTFW